MTVLPQVILWNCVNSLKEDCDMIEIGFLRLQGHFNVCHYEDVVCDDCDEQMQRRFLEEHMTSECRNRIVQCEHCGEEFAFWRTEVSLSL